MSLRRRHAGVRQSTKQGNGPRCGVSSEAGSASRQELGDRARQLADAVRAVSAETRVRLVPVVIDAVTQEPRVAELARAVAGVLP